MECFNIKIEVLLFKKIILKNIMLKLTNKKNYLIFHFKTMKFTIYKSNFKKIHVTGIHDKYSFRLLIILIQKYLKCKIKKIHIQNSLFRFLPKKCLNIEISKLAKVIHTYSSSLFKVSLNFEIFPAIIVKPLIFYKKLLPTCLIFSNGKCIFIGGKNKKILSCYLAMYFLILKIYYKKADSCKNLSVDF